MANELTAIFIICLITTINAQTPKGYQAHSKIGDEYIVWQFKPDLTIDALSKKSLIEREIFWGENGKEKITVIKKKYWLEECWDIYWNNTLESVNQELTANKRVLILFQGTFEKRTGFQQFLNNNDGERLKILKLRYGNRIFLFNYPTLSQGIRENVDTLMRVFSICGFENSQIDLIGTSRGCLVARQLIVDYGEKASFIKSLICVNGPNLGTPIASVANFLKKNKGIKDQRSRSNKFLEKLNEDYNKLLNRNNHHYLGTEGSKIFRPLFKNQRNDGIISAASMMGEKNKKATFGYRGKELMISKENKLFISRNNGGRGHGNHFKTLLILKKIVEIIEDVPLK